VVAESLQRSPRYPDNRYAPYASGCLVLMCLASDDEKYLLQRDAKKQADLMKTHKLKKPVDLLNYYHQMGLDNIKDIIACGFLPEKTFIFTDLDYVG
jgi:tryptophanyl-tRNA synthetase